MPGVLRPQTQIACCGSKMPTNNTVKIKGDTRYGLFLPEFSKFFCEAEGFDQFAGSTCTREHSFNKYNCKHSDHEHENTVRGTYHIDEAGTKIVLGSAQTQTRLRLTFSGL